MTKNTQSIYLKVLSFISLFLFCVPTMASQSGSSAVTPLSLGIVSPVQFPPEDVSVVGVRLSAIFGHHRNVTGIDLGGIGNITDQVFTGAAISGLFNATRGTTTVLGLQFAGLTNMNFEKTSVYGLQAAIAANYNSAQSTVVGLQLAIANMSAFTSVYGAQFGVYNRAQEVHGFQIGIVNVTDALYGIQIGVINFNRRGPIGVSPILNIGF